MADLNQRLLALSLQQDISVEAIQRDHGLIRPTGFVLLTKLPGPPLPAWTKGTTAVPPDFWYTWLAQRLHDLNALIFDDAYSHAVICNFKTDALRLQAVAVELQANAEVGGPEYDLKLADLSREANMMQRYLVTFANNNRAVPTRRDALGRLSEPAKFPEYSIDGQLVPYPPEDDKALLNRVFQEARRQNTSPLGALGGQPDGRRAARLRRHGIVILPQNDPPLSATVFNHTNNIATANRPTDNTIPFIGTLPGSFDSNKPGIRGSSAQLGHSVSVSIRKVLTDIATASGISFDDSDSVSDDEL